MSNIYGDNCGYPRPEGPQGPEGYPGAEGAQGFPGSIDYGSIPLTKPCEKGRLWIDGGVLKITLFDECV